VQRTVCNDNNLEVLIRSLCRFHIPPDQEADPQVEHKDPHPLAANPHINSLVHVRVLTPYDH
jgi:hypothetical protein